MIELKNISKNYGNVEAVNNLSFKIEKGELFGILGPNGAGKTTTVNMINGMISPTTGTIQVNDYFLQENPIEVKFKIGYVPEESHLYDQLTGYEFLEMIGSIYEMKEEKLYDRINKYLSFWNLQEDAHKILSSYSKGMKQKILVTSAIIHSPEILILDEPFSGLDPNAVLLTKELIKNFLSEDTTVIFCSHILEVVENLCTKVLIISEGEKVSQGTIEETCQQANRDNFEEAFSSLTGVSNPEKVTADFIDALE